jgi:hypothetical protein
MRNYPLLTNLCPKTDGKYKVAVVGPDSKSLQEFARTAADLGFKSTLISALLIGDPTRIYIREMLTKARSREEFYYDIERQEQAHYELLHTSWSLMQVSWLREAISSIEWTLPDPGLCFLFFCLSPTASSPPNRPPEFHIISLIQIPSRGAFMIGDASYSKQPVARAFTSGWRRDRGCFMAQEVKGVLVDILWLKMWTDFSGQDRAG